MCQRLSKEKACNSNAVGRYGLASARFITVILPRPDRPKEPTGKSAWGWNIRAARLARGIGTAEASGLIGVAQNTLFGWEAGRTVPKVFFIPGIIGFIGYVPMRFSPYQSSLGASFRAARELRGLRIVDLAALAGLGAKQVWNIESDAYYPEANCARIERALSIPVRKCFLSHNKGDLRGL